MELGLAGAKMCGASTLRDARRGRTLRSVRRIAGVCVAVGAVAGSLLPAAALAADATIDFESLAPGTTVTNQFADVGGSGEGVVFGPLPGAGGNGFRPIVKTVPAGQAHSGTRVGDIGCNVGNCEFVNAGTTGTFQNPRKKVSVRVGVDGTPPAPSCGADPARCTDATLQAYNANGDPIGPSSTATAQGGGNYVTLSVELASASIRGFKITTGAGDGGEPVSIDDLTFDVPTTPAPPDFTLTPESTFLTMSQGQTLTVPIAIGRTGGSAGDVDFAASGALPAGVTASFQPDPASGNATNLVLSAAPNAELTPQGGFEPITFNVTGTPGPGAGPEPRSFPVSLQVREAFRAVLVGSSTVDVSSCVAKVPIRIERDFGFPGPVSMSVDGLANGLQASFEPQQLTFPNGAGAQTTNLVVTAPETGQPIPPTTLTIRAGAPGFPDRVLTVTATGACPYQYDPRVTSLEITQGVQSEVLPQRYAEYPGSPIPYAEIPNTAQLRRSAPTVVRVYANLSFGPTEGVRNIPAVLYGSYKDSIGNRKPHAGSPISPIAGPSLLKTGPELPTQSEIGSETAVYTFVLPESWTKQTLSISAQILPSTSNPARAVRPCETAACLVNDAMGIVSIPFGAAPSVWVNPLDLQVNGAGNPSPDDVFKWLRMATPVKLYLNPYQATFDITDEFNDLQACLAAAPAGDPGRDERVDCSNDANSAAAQYVKDWVCDKGNSDTNFVVGVNSGVARGLQSDSWCWSRLEVMESAVVERMRPLTSVGHEVGHLFGRPHADLLCGGDSDGQDGEAWPPDDMGFLQSVGLSTDVGTGVSGGPYKVMAPPTQWFDYMSYCAGESNAWISVRNWNRIFEKYDYDRAARRADERAPAPRGPMSASLRVSGFASGEGASITAVEPVDSPAQPPSDSAYRLLGLDAAGNTVAEARMVATAFHADGQPPGLSLDAVIPAAGVEAVAIAGDAGRLATRAASQNTPDVSVKGKPRFRGRKATLRWDADDADGDELAITVEYSGDGGRTYEEIWGGPNEGTAEVPARYLPRSPRARLRISANDGFRQGSDVSKSFSSPGEAPLVEILSPAPKFTQPNDAPLALRGAAFDDASNQLAGRDLRWFIGRRQIGTGEQISPIGLPAGRHRVTLEARDDAGRTARDSVAVRLSAAPPLFLELDAPGEVGRKARSLKLRVASSTAAKLEVNGAAGKQTFAVGRKERALEVEIPRGSRTLNLRLELKSGGKSSKRLLSIERG